MTARRTRNRVAGRGSAGAVIVTVLTLLTAGCAAGPVDPAGPTGTGPAVIRPTDPPPVPPGPPGTTTHAPPDPVRPEPATPQAEAATAPAEASTAPLAAAAAAAGQQQDEPAAADFVSSVGPIDAALAARMRTSWRPGCPVALADLRYVTVSHVGFDGAEHTGELVVSARTADAVVRVFAELHRQRFPIASMRLVDDFAVDGVADDGASMAADNTSAFNCRAVTGGSGWSEHSFGEAIDLNPVENPYRSASGQVQPEAGAAHLDRAPAPGVVRAGDAVVRAFAAIGWSWGGDWTSPVDWQHFSASGR